MLKTTVQKFTFFMLIAICGILYLSRNIIMPFAAAAILAYFLNPIAIKMKKFGVSNALASVITIVIAIFKIAIIFVIIVPILYHGISSIVQKAIENKTKIIQSINSLIDWVGDISPFIATQIQSNIPDLYNHTFAFLKNALKELLKSTTLAVDLMTFCIILPIAMYYMIKDAEGIKIKLHNLIPRRFKKKTSAIFKDLDASLSSYIKGQFAVCFIMSIFYSISFSVIGLHSGIVIGLLAGILTFFPYVGAFISWLICILTCFIYFAPDQSEHYMLVVTAIFAFGQMVEGNYLSPKIIGESTDIHPIYIIIGLMLGGNLFGFWGVLLALPATVVISVLLKHFVLEYKSSNLYL